MLNSIFKGSDHAHIVWHGGKEYQTVKRQPTNEEYLQHLQGKKAIGIIPINKHDLTNIGALDIDTHHNNGGKVDIQKLLKKINFFGLPLTVSESKSGGAHCWLTLSKEYFAKDVRHILKKFQYALGYDDNNCEIFPKQETLFDEKRNTFEIGNGLNLPCFGNERSMYDMEGNKLSNEKGLEFISKRLIGLENCKPWKLLQQKDKQQHSNDRTWCASTFIKKHHPDDWQDKVREYDQLFNNPPLATEGGANNRLEQTIIKSNERKDYFDTQLEEKIIDLNSYCINDYIKLNIPKPVFITEKLFRERSNNWLIGAKGKGKTELTLGMVNAMVRGLPFLKYKHPYCFPVTYIDAEMDPYDMIERDLAYRNTFGNPPSNYLKMINYALQEGQSFPDLRDDNFHNLLIKKLEQQFEQTGKKPLLVLDNLRSLSSYKENDSDDFNKINKFFLRLKAEGYTTLVLDHLGKSAGAGARGSSAKTDNATVVMQIEPISSKGSKKMKMEIKFDKARGLRPEDTESYVAEYDFHGNWTMGQAPAEEDRSKVKLRVKEMLKEKHSQKKIAETLGWSTAYISGICKEIKAEDVDKNSPI